MNQMSVDSREQEEAVLRWLTTCNVGMPRMEGMDVEMARALATKLIAEGEVTVQTLRLAGKEWLLDG